MTFHNTILILLGCDQRTTENEDAQTQRLCTVASSLMRFVTNHNANEPSFLHKNSDVSDSSDDFQPR